jgi:hypothetical protein
LKAEQLDKLCLATYSQKGKPSIAPVVKVKKPNEKDITDQSDEIELLHSMGLHASVIRLIELPKEEFKISFDQKKFLKHTVSYLTRAQIFISF